MREILPSYCDPFKEPGSGGNNKKVCWDKMQANLFPERAVEV
jgi:hypothetical protein